MVKIIAGEKGTGKTKRMIRMANDDVQSLNGHVVFIDDDKRHIYDLNHDLRFMCMEEFPVKTPEEFFGFLCGVISNDYDIEKVYIDGLLKIAGINERDLPSFVPRLEELTKQYNFNVVFTVSGDKQTLPNEITPYYIE
ncbi:twitching motility protein PilT [Fusibacter sp. JL216-2]|uniref:twitching motility protein PilT n=1 Tax=Fusibacter sp. JL216-2 TaxID=3071453 RepID=UPI003D32C918